MYEPNPVLRSIIVDAVDNAVVVEVYNDDATPPFDPSQAIKRFSPTEITGATEFLGLECEKKITKMGRAKRTSGKEINTFSTTFDNLSREIAAFELTEGFEGKILVLRLISRSLSTDLSHSLILWAGRCKKPEDGNKMELDVSTEQVFGTIDKDIPRRKFTPEDPEGRAASDPLFEGFIHLPQYGTSTYIRTKKILFGLFKKKVRETLQWSSFSDIDATKDLPFGFGKVQILGTNLGYADKGTQLHITAAFLEGEIKAFLYVRSTDPRFTGPQGGGKLMRGELGGTGDQTGVLGPASILPFPANGLYSRTAVAFGVYDGTRADEVDPAPDIAATMLASLVNLPDSAGGWTAFDWSDNGAALVRFALTDNYLENLHENWLNDPSFTDAWDFNDEFLFDNTFSDLIFVPQGVITENLESSGLTQPTNAVTPEYLKYKQGELSAEETFNQKVRYQEIDPESIDVPIDPDDFPDPGEDPGGAPSNINLSVFLRRRYTCNIVANEKQPLWDWLNEKVLPGSRMFLSQGFDGKISLKHKKPVDFAIGLEGFEANSNTLEVDDVSKWISNKTGYLLIQPHSNISEVRKVVNANYSNLQNSSVLTASSNISVDGFSGSDGAQNPATATLAVNSVLTDNPNWISLDGEEIAVIGVEEDDNTTLAGFFYGSINAHPRLRRKFKAVWNDDEVIITAKFGTLVLDENIDTAHPSPIDNPAGAPSLSADTGNLRAGFYYVSYAYQNANGRTLIAPAASITLTDNQKIVVDGVFNPSDSVIWYVSPEPGSKKLRKIFANDGSQFEIDSLPKLTGELPNDFNRTGTEVIRVQQVFSDRALARAHTQKSFVLKDSYRWILGRRNDSKNLVVLTFRDVTQDYRLVELRVRDDEHIAKVKKENKLEIDGASIDNFHQAFRIASGALAEARDADFFYEWQSDREALFLEEADVVCITDAGAGVVNFPVIIESIEYDDLIKAHPTVSFVGRKYSSTLYDDSVVDRQIPVIQSLDQFATEIEADNQLSQDLEFTSDEKGVVLIDRATETKYRLKIENGVLGLEEVVEPEAEEEIVMF